MQEPEIIYEDNHLIAVNKPAGWLVQGDDTGDRPLSDWVKAYIKKKYQKPGDVYLGVLHRIDRPVSGLVMFARTSKAAERMSKMIQNHKIKKYYLAEVKGMLPEPEGTLKHFILRNESNNTSKAHIRPVPDSKPAHLDYRVLEQHGNVSVVEVLLHTGRHHQIRAQMSAMGCPIVGDLKYGYPTALPDASIHLHAYKLEFEHPVTKVAMDLESRPPFL